MADRLLKWAAPILAASLASLVLIAILLPAPNEDKAQQRQDPTGPDPGPSQQKQETKHPSKPTLEGIAAVDITERIEGQGVRCGPMRVVKNDEARWHCQDTLSEFVVDVWGYSETEIYEISATYTNLTDSDTDTLAASPLSYIASVPYASSEPSEAEASAWVLENIGAGARQKRFGDTLYTLHGAADWRSLYIRPQRDAKP